MAKYALTILRASFTPVFVEPKSPASAARPSLTVDIFPSGQLASHAAAHAAAGCLREILAQRGGARIMVGTGNSQLEMIRTLVRLPGIAWGKVEAFHLDEYVGLPATHPASFRWWIRQQFAEPARPLATHYIEGDAADLEGMMQAYGRRLLAEPIDLAFVGIGENGHIAFNDPPVADFNDVHVVKRVALDEACRRQQVGEGHFPNLESVPREAVSVTCTGLFRAARWICCVPDRRKARAVQGSLEGPLSTACPGSLIRTHPAAALYLDAESASLLSADTLKTHCRRHDLNSGAPAAG